MHINCHALTQGSATVHLIFQMCGMSVLYVVHVCVGADVQCLHIGPSTLDYNKEKLATNKQ